MNRPTLRTILSHKKGVAAGGAVFLFCLLTAYGYYQDVPSKVETILNSSPLDFRSSREGAIKNSNYPSTKSFNYERKPEGREPREGSVNGFQAKVKPSKDKSNASEGKSFTKKETDLSEEERGSLRLVYSTRSQERGLPLRDPFEEKALEDKSELNTLKDSKESNLLESYGLRKARKSDNGEATIKPLNTEIGDSLKLREKKREALPSQESGGKAEKDTKEAKSKRSDRRKAYQLCGVVQGEVPLAIIEGPEGSKAYGLGEGPPGYEITMISEDYIYWRGSRGEAKLSL